MSRTIAEHRDKAEEVIAGYCDPRNLYAYRTYDRVTHDGPLTPEDVLMANLMSLRLTWNDVVPLFATGAGPAQRLRRSLNCALVDLRSGQPFEDHESVESLEASVAGLAAANEAALEVRNWTYVTVSKVLHRRRPHIVPIMDSRVRNFYGTRKPASIRAALWSDISKNRDWLHDVATGFPRPDGVEMSLLRAADILIWRGDP